MRALVVDDSRAMRAILNRLLGNIGYEVTTVEGGPEGLEALVENDPFDLLFVDWNMPKMNGCEFVKQVRSDPDFASVRIVMCTTETDIKYVNQALEAGANEYVMKPFTEEIIREKLKLIGAGVL